MPKATLMVRFKRPADPNWIRKPAVYGSTGRVRSGFAEFTDPETREKWVEDIGENYTFDVRVEDHGTTYEPVGKNAVDAEAKRVKIAAKFKSKAASEALGLVVIDPTKEKKKRLRLEDTFDDYIEYEEKRGVNEAREQAILVKAEFLRLVAIIHVDEVTRDAILTYDATLRENGRSGRTIANKRQRLQSMLRFAGVDPSIFPPKPKYEKKLPTIYTPTQLAGLFKAATPYETIAAHLALKLGLRDQEVQFAEFTDISWHESVYRVRSKPQYKFTVKVPGVESASMAQSRPGSGWSQNNDLTLDGVHLEGQNVRSNFVGVNDYRVGELATEHLITQGCRRIAHILGPANSVGNDRAEGYRDTLKRRGMAFTNDYMISAGDSSESAGEIRGRYAMEVILKLKPRPDGLFCFNDTIAVGAMFKALEAGASIPNDLAIVGCGNFHYSGKLLVPLTSVDQRAIEIGKRTARMMVHLHDKQSSRNRKVILEPQLIVRASSQLK